MFLQNILSSGVAVTKEFSKDAYILREGEVEKNIYIIKTGAVRIFRLTEHEEQSVRFGYSGSVITSISSFLSGKPSEFYIQALRKTILHSISKINFEKELAGSAENLVEYNQLLAETITGQMDREIDLLTASPAERLKRVLERSPALFQEIPLKYIASYLRMAPETLSRLRNS